MLESYDIHIIKVICESGSLNKAADILCVSQSTLSKRLSRLESTLGVSLFYRNSSGMAPTPAAQYMIEQGKDIRDRLSGIDRHVKMLGALATGDIKVGVGPIIEQVFFPELLLRYSQATQNMRIKLVTGSTQELAALLYNGGIDIALGPFVPDQLDESLICSSVAQDNIVFVARAEHPIFSYEGEQAQQNMLNYPSIGPEIPENIKAQIPADLLPYVPTISCGNYHTSKSFALRSDYITGGPKILFQAEIEAGKLRVLPAMPTPRWESYLVFKPESVHVPSVAKFIEIVQSLPDFS